MREEQERQKTKNRHDQFNTANLLKRDRSKKADGEVGKIVEVKRQQRERESTEDKTRKILEEVIERLIQQIVEKIIAGRIVKVIEKEVIKGITGKNYLKIRITF